MKTISFLSAALMSLFLFPADLLAAGPVTTGTLTAVDRKMGTMTLLSNQTGRPVKYFGMKGAVIRFDTGKAASFGDLAVGQNVMVEYANYKGRLIVANVSIPSPKPPPAPNYPAPLTPGERRGLYSKAARDRDITTQPGSKARTDNDITTQPGKHSR